MTDAIPRRTFIGVAVSGLLPSSLAHAQSRPGRKPRVGVLWHAANVEEETPYYQSLAEGFRQLGYIEERNLTVDHRFPDEKASCSRAWPPSSSR
jgi:putative ABC transport system substrate-binding protein